MPSRAHILGDFGRGWRGFDVVGTRLLLRTRHQRLHLVLADRLVGCCRAVHVREAVRASVGCHLSCYGMRHGLTVTNLATRSRVSSVSPTATKVVIVEQSWLAENIQSAAEFAGAGNCQHSLSCHCVCTALKAQNNSNVDRI